MDRPTADSRACFGATKHQTAHHHQQEEEDKCCLTACGSSGLLLLLLHHFPPQFSTSWSCFPCTLLVRHGAGSAPRSSAWRGLEPARPASTLHRAARAGCHRGCQSPSAGLNPLSLSLAVEACTCHGELEN